MNTINETKIPRIIHYCWFGKGEMPALLQKCVESWSKFPDYEIMRWDESNCNFDENDFVRRAYEEKRWGYIGDYYRLKAIYEYGGIYLDTDVEMFNDFEPLLNNNVFFGFNFDCCIGTGIIGSAPHEPYIRELMNLYENTKFVSDSKKPFCLDEKDHVIVNGFHTSNFYHTAYVLKHFDKFRLDNSQQELGAFTIYPKEFFEIGKLDKSQYTIHYNTGSWKTKKNGHGRFVTSFLNFAKKYPKFDYVLNLFLRKRRYKKANKRLPFYVCQTAQKKGEKVPVIW